ncbi:metallophosphoesterase [Variovorax sp. YR216]|uniref:metallophosphoesterase n=1 Tax=Variovorax sp. YR216 TaxID=1882828 RepID=UPI000895275A|nr:metallophosphoesterase [Variovorax sp. YR216]SEB19822.1 Calcineurin-like phosphoesterase [Variovorax sp. YR216]
MRLLVLSDLHCEFGNFEVPTHLEFDVAVLTGDIYQPGELAVQWALQSEALASRQAILVPGNHEYYRRSRQTRMDRTLAAMRELAARTHVHVLDADELVLEGVRFLGATLWTDFALAIETPQGPQTNVELAERLVENALNDFRLIRVPNRSALPGTWQEREGRIFRGEDARRIHHEQRRWLKQRLETPFDGKTVVLTHHAPHRGSLAPWYASDWVSAGFISELPDEFFAVPVLWVHGHTHTSFDYRVGNCRVLSNPRGYMPASGVAENAQFNPRLVVTV